MNSNQENMYPFIAMDGRDYLTKEEMEEANKRFLAAKAGIPQNLDPEQAAYERMMNKSYQAAGPVPQVAEAEMPHKR